MNWFPLKFWEPLFFLILNSILSFSLHPLLFHSLSPTVYTWLCWNCWNLIFITQLNFTSCVCVVVSQNFLPPTEDLTGCCWAQSPLPLNDRYEENFWERLFSLQPLYFSALYAHTPNTLTPCLIRVLKKQGRTHHPVLCSSQWVKLPDELCYIPPHSLQAKGRIIPISKSRSCF